MKAKKQLDMKRLGKNLSDNIPNYIAFLLMGCITVILIALMIWGAYTAVKSQINWYDDKVGLPKGHIWEWSWSNYKTVFQMFVVKVDYTDSSGVITAAKVPINLMYMGIYTLVYAGFGAFVQSVVTCVMGYMTAKFPYKASKIITVVVITVMALPVVGSYTSELQIMMKLGLYNTLVGAVIQKFNFLGMYFLVFQSFFKGMGNEFAEAASIDGASEFKILFRIMMPLARNILFTVVLLNFVAYWNDYQSPLLYFPSYPTIAYGLYYITAGAGAYETVLSSPPMRLASSMLVFIPILTVFLIFRNRIIGNVSMGGVKE